MKKLMAWWLGAISAFGALGSALAATPSSAPPARVTVVDLLMVYTAAARADAGGTEVIESQIQSALFEANTVFQNSLVNARFRLVGSREVAYDESGSVSNDLARLRDPRDGFMDEVHVWREHTAADLVCLITTTGSDWDFYGLQGPSAANAFSILRRPFLTGYNYLPVALSFNFGCQLERRYADSVGAFPYSYGYSFTDTNRASFSTVEAFSGTRLPFFSNPGIQYHGVAAGLPAGMLNAADNSRGLNLTAPMVAAFRGGAAVTLPPTIRLTRPPEGVRVRQGEPVAISAAASDADGTVTRVDFYADQTWVGRATHAPFTCSWSNAPCGTHALTALAQDDAGGTTTSDVVTITVSPTNDDFIRAVVLSGTNLTVTGATAGASLEPGESDTGGASVWFKWTAPVSGRVTVHIPAPGDGDYLAVYTGDSVSNLTLVAQNQVWTWWGWVSVPSTEFSIRAGEVLFLKVDGGSGGPGYFTMNLDLDPAPTNDDFANATILADSQSEITGSTATATLEPGEPRWSGPSVWYSWQAAAKGRLRLTMSERNLACTFAVYTGDSVGNLTLVAQCGAWDNAFDLPVLAGTNYMIVVAGSVASFTLDLDYQPAPPNDDFENRVALGNGESAEVNNYAATIQAGEPLNLPVLGFWTSPSHRTVWWTWTAPAKGEVTFYTVCDFFSVVCAYAGDTLTNLELIGWGLAAAGPLRVPAGAILQVAGDGVNGSTGIMRLSTSFTPAPAGDDFADSASVSGFSPVLRGTTVAATAEPGEPCHGGVCGQRSIWWTWTAPLSGYVTVTATSNSIAPVLAVYTGSAVSNLNAVASSSGGPLSFEAVEGTSYHIAAADATGGPCELEVTVSTVRIVNPSNGARFTNGSEIVLTATVTPNDGQVAQVDFLQNGVWLGSATNPPFSLQWTNVPGGAYVLVAVATDVLGVTHGSPPVSVVARPVNDDFADASILTADGPPAAGSNVGATSEPGDPSGNGSIWWVWTAPTQGWARLVAAGTGLCPLIQVYTGSALSNLVSVAVFSAWYYQSPTAGALAVQGGETYRISIVGNWRMTEGDVALSLFFEPSPSNDNFENRTVLSGASLLITNNLGTASCEPGEPGAGPKSKSLWWSWTATNSGQVTLVGLSTCGNPTLGIYTGEAVSNLVEVASGPTVARFNAVAGTTYQITERTDGCPDLRATARLQLIADSPSNDLFTSRAFVQGLPLTVSNNNLNASIEPGELGWRADGRTLWWAWTAPSTGLLTLSTEGSSGLPMLAVFTGTNLTNLVFQGSNVDPSAWWDPVAQSTQLKVRAGQTYAISADEDDLTGLIVLTFVGITPTPSNDDFADRVRLMSWAHTGMYALLSNATREPGEPETSYGHTVWGIWTAPFSGGADVWTMDGGLTISIYTGNSFTNLIQVAGSGWGTYAEFRAEGGSDYVIRVDGASGTHRMSVDEFPAPTNDNFANRTVLVGSNLTVAGLAFGAGHEPGEPRDPFAAGTGSAWWSWRAPATGFLSLSVNAGFSAIWGVFLGESLTNLTPVFTGPGQAIRFRVVQGNTYQIGVDSQGWPMLNSSWSLDFGPGPMNDAFSHATALDGLTPVIRDIIANATIEPGEPVLDANPLAGSAWYVWTAPASGRVTLTTSDDSPACLMGVFTGSDVAHLSEVTLPASQKVVFGAEAGTSYRIMLETSDLTTNPVTLSLAFESSPGNDNFVHRSLLTGASATVTGSLFNATPEQGELELGIPLGSQSVWYAWTAPMSGLATVSASGDGWTPAVTAFTGASITNLALVQQDWGTIAFAVRAGTTYQLAVSSDENLAAPFTLTLNLEIPPTNDDFSNRAFLAGFKATGGGSFRAATGEPGEPAHEGGAATHSLWWTWIAPADGLARIYRDSPGDYGLATEQQAIYLGPELSNLTLVASSVTTNLVFQAVAGTAYQLAFNSDTPSSEPLAFRLELPQVIIVSPTNGQRWIESTDMLIEAQILDPNGTFRQVDFFVGSNLLASVTNAPFSVLCKKVPVGRYVLTARTTDESGDMSTSEAIEVTVLPGNDDFVNRFPLLTATLSVTGDIASASSEPSEPLLPSATGQTLWWSWSAPFSGVLTITSARSLFPSPLDHYPVIQEPDPPIFSPVLPPVGPNERRSGKSVVIIVFPPFHPPGPPDLLASGSSGGPGLAVYLGETLTSLTLLASDIYYYEGSWRVPPFPGWRAFPSLSFRVQAGQTYQIAVDGLNNSTGVAILDFDFVRDPLPPPNDSFAGRFALAGSSVSGSGTTVSATREPGEPNHGVETDAAERTVWWSWSAPGSGTASLASDLDSVGFAVYIGNSPASLLLIVSGQTQVTFEAKAGVEYQIVAFTAAEVQTDFSFSLQGPVPAPVVSGITFDAGSGGVSQVRVAGTTGQSFAVQASTNLVDWATVGVDTLQGAWSDFMDADAIRFPYRFYRLQPLESVLTPQILRVGFSPSPAASGCSLLISGPAGQPFRLRASADLAHWVDIYQGVIIGDGASFVDADARSFPARFYQIMPLP